MQEDLRLPTQFSVKSPKKRFVGILNSKNAQQVNRNQDGDQTAVGALPIIFNHRKPKNPKSKLEGTLNSRLSKKDIKSKVDCRGSYVGRRSVIEIPSIDTPIEMTDELRNVNDRVRVKALLDRDDKEDIKIELERVISVQQLHGHTNEMNKDVNEVHTSTELNGNSENMDSDSHSLKNVEEKHDEFVGDSPDSFGGDITLESKRISTPLRKVGEAEGNRIMGKINHRSKALIRFHDYQKLMKHFQDQEIQMCYLDSLIGRDWPDSEEQSNMSDDLGQRHKHLRKQISMRKDSDTMMHIPDRKLEAIQEETAKRTKKGANLSDTTNTIRQSRQCAKEEEEGHISEKIKVKSTSISAWDLILYKKNLKSSKRMHTSIIYQIEKNALQESSCDSEVFTSLVNGRTFKKPSKVKKSCSVENSVHTCTSIEDTNQAMLYLEENDLKLSWEEIYEEAVLAESKQSWRRAILLSTACCIVDKEWFLPLLLKARCFTRLGLWFQGIQDISAAIRLNPKNVKLYLQRAYIYGELKEYARASSDVNLALVERPKCCEALLLRSKMYTAQGIISLAIKDLTTVVQLSPRSWQPYYHRGVLRHRVVEGDEEVSEYHWEDISLDGLILQVITDYIMALKTGCTLSDLVEIIGDLYVKLYEILNDTEVLLQGIHEFTDLNLCFRGNQGSNENLELLDGEKVLKLDLNASLMTQRGRLFAILSRFDKASLDLDQAVVLDYGYAPGHFYRGAVAALTVTQDTDKKRVVQDLTRAVSIDPTTSGAYIVRVLSVTCVYLIKGGLYFQDMEYNLALHDFRTAVTINPLLDEIWLQIALIYLNHYHDCEACIQASSVALELDLTLTQALFLRGEALSRQGHNNTALRNYSKISLLYPGNRWSNYLRGKILLQLNKPKTALYCYVQFMDYESICLDESSQSYIQRGKAYKVLNNFSNAVADFKRAAEINPNAGNLCLLSEALIAMGDVDGSMQAIEKAIKCNPSSYEAYVRRAECFHAMEKYKLAIGEFNKALVLAPRDPDVLHGRAISKTCLYSELLRQSKRYRNGFGVLDDASSSNNVNSKKLAPTRPSSSKLVNSNPRNFSAQAEEIAILLKTTFSSAVSDYSKCIRLNPTSAETFVNRAELYFLEESYDKALDDYAKAVEIDPLLLSAYINCGVLNSYFRSYAAAIANYDQAIKANSSCWLAYYNRGVVYHTLRSYAQANKDYTKACELVGKTYDIIRNRAIVRCFVKDYHGALDDFHEIERNYPDDVEIYPAIGYVLHNLNRHQEAINYFKVTACNNPNSVSALLNTGNTYLAISLEGRNSDPQKSLMLLVRAKNFFLRAIMVDPSNINSRCTLSSMFCLAREWYFANQQFLIIEAIDETNNYAYEGKALIKMQQNQFDEAISELKRGLLVCCSNDRYLQDRQLCFHSEKIKSPSLQNRIMLRQNAENERLENNDQIDTKDIFDDKLLGPILRDKKSLICASESTKLNLCHLLLNHGIAMEKLLKNKDAMVNYEIAIIVDKTNVHALLNKGTLELHTSCFDKAVGSLHICLKLRPQSELCLLNLGAAYFQIGEITKAENFFTQCLSQNVNNAFAWANLANIHQLRKKTKQAEKCYDKAIENLPTYNKFYVHRGHMLASQGRIREAMIDYSTALHLDYTGDL